MRAVKSCGVVVFREQPERAFLLLRQAHRWDLPKGHVEAGEDDQQTALRELVEETGIAADGVRLDPAFRFETSYQFHARRFGGERVHKTVVIYLGWLLAPSSCEIVVSEHLSHQWFPWAPPHRIQDGTIDDLLAQVDRYFREGDAGR